MKNIFKDKTVKLISGTLIGTMLSLGSLEYISNQTIIRSMEETKTDFDILFSNKDSSIIDYVVLDFKRVNDINDIPTHVDGNMEIITTGLGDETLFYYKESNPEMSIKEYTNWSEWSSWHLLTKRDYELFFLHENNENIVNRFKIDENGNYYISFSVRVLKDTHLKPDYLRYR